MALCRIRIAEAGVRFSPGPNENSMNLLLNTINIWGYPAIFVGGFIEGLNVTLVSSFFIAQGIFSAWLVLLASATGNFFSDLMWYGLGKKYGENFLMRISKLLPFVNLVGKKIVIEKIKSILNQHRGLAIFITKFTIGPGIATQVIAGVVDMPLKNFAMASFLANFAFTATLIFIGFLFGQSYILAAQFVRHAEFLILIFLILLLVMQTIGVDGVKKILFKNS